MSNEVLSVPVGITGELVERFKVHACPERFPYRDTDYITFRYPGGIMKEIYGLKDYQILVIDPFDDDALEKHKTKEYFKQLHGYIASRRGQGSFTSEPYRFYILNDHDVIPLAHNPSMAHNPQGHCYFTEEELTSGKAIVQVSSKKNTRGCLNA